MKQVITFEGQVNGQRFTDRDEMSRYITRLMENNQSINDLQYSTKTQWVQEDDEKGCGVDCRKESPAGQPMLPWNEYIKEAQKEIPDAYDTILGYLIPYVNEEPFTNFAPEHEDELFEDLKQKLTRRMGWMEQHLFSECRRRKEAEAVDPAMMKFFRNLYHSFLHKAEWAGDRVCFMNWILGEVEDEKLTWGIKKDTILYAIKVYEEVESFCRACADIVADNTECYD